VPPQLTVEGPLPCQKREYETNENKEINEFSFVSYSLFCLRYCKPRLPAVLSHMKSQSIFCVLCVLSLKRPCSYDDGSDG
jgi:hypothetical protein